MSRGKCIAKLINIWTWKLEIENSILAVAHVWLSIDDISASADGAYMAGFAMYAVC